MSNEAFIDSLPKWGQTLARRYFSETATLFILHGAVNDLIFHKDEQGDHFYRLPQFLEKVLFAGRDHVLHYDRSKGLTFDDNQTANDFRNFLQATDTATGSAYSKSIPAQPASVLRLLERYINIRRAENKSLALVIDYADTIVPQSDAGHASESDRSARVALQRLASDPEILGSDVTIVLICENLAGLNTAVVRSPFVETIEVPFPNQQERLDFIRARFSKKKFTESFDLTDKAMAALTSGLGRVHLLQILNEAKNSKKKLGQNALMKRKKALIESECYGLLEFFEPKYNLDRIAGHAQAKIELRNAAKMIKKGRLDVLPMGYLIAGPVGTGKTYLATCFTGEIGIPCVRILNIRSQWQGVTESNMQKLLTLFKAMGPLGVIIDEADAFLGDRAASGDSGTSSRVFSQIASFMSNTEYRGHILWFLLTCRPDLLPVDIKRQGRAEEHLALFHPESAKDRHELFEVFIKKNGLTTSVRSIESIYQAVGAPMLSGADLEAVIIRAKKVTAIAGRKTVTKADFSQAFEVFVPPVYAEEVEYQTLTAVMECTNRNLLPNKYKEMPRENIAQRLMQLRALID